MMVAFQVRVNGKKVCIAGMPDPGLLNTIVTVGRRRPVPNARGRAAKQLTLYLHVGGLDTRDAARPEHLRWTVPQLRVGDRIAIRIVEAKKVDAPSTRHHDAPEIRKAREKYFAEMKRQLGKKRD